MPTIAIKPTWSRYEKDMRSGNADKAIKATEAFTTEREKALANSRKLKNWEADRKKELAKAKPKWVKDRIKKEESDRLKPYTFFKQAGTFKETKLYPAPGYVLVLPDSTEEVTETGIILTDNKLDNRGQCMAVGGQLILDHNNEKVAQPCQAGDHVFYKLGAGLNLKLGDKDYRFMQFSDILGTFVDD